MYVKLCMCVMYVCMLCVCMDVVCVCTLGMLGYVCNVVMLCMLCRFGVL